MRHSVTYRDAFWFALAQWPASFVILSWVKAYPRAASRPSLELAALVLCGLGGVIWFGKHDGKMGLTRIVSSVVCVAAASAMAFRDSDVALSLLLIAIALAMGFVAMFKAAHRRTAGVSFSLVLLATAAFVVEAVTDPSSRFDRPLHNTITGKAADLDPKLTIRLIPNAQQREVVTIADGTPLFDATYHIDADGTRRIAGRPDHGPIWSTVGCSYTFGVGLNDETTIGQRLQDRHPTVRVFNHGVWGFGTGDVLLYLQEVLARQPDTHLVVYFFIDDHIRRVALPHAMLIDKWGRAKPRFRSESGRPVYVGKASDRLNLWELISIKLAGRSWLWNRFVTALTAMSSESDSDVDLATQLIVSMRDECRRLPDCRFVVVRLPQDTSFYKVGAAHLERWKSQLAQAQITVLDFAPVFQEHLTKTVTKQSDYFFDVDGHPRPSFVEMLVLWLEPHLAESIGAAGASGANNPPVVTGNSRP